jgi:UDP-GlcNAc:undecaprenyl-phosphate GlcNAc-1-phosphate transferase
VEMLRALAFSCAIGACATSASIFVATRVGLLDRPGGIKIHVRPVPPVGGLALLMTIAVGASFLALSPAIVMGAASIWAVGFADDVLRLSPRAKLLLQLLPIAIVSWTQRGTSVESTLGAFAAGVVIVNAVNILDGLDGLAAGVALFALLPIVFASGPQQDLATLTAGACAGFLLFNVPPARVFLGDEGSLLLGYVLWTEMLALSAFGKGGVVTAALVAAIPLVNLTFVVVRRAVLRRPIWIGDRLHLYDASYRRFGLRNTIISAWVLAAIASAIGVAMTY